MNKLQERVLSKLDRAELVRITREFVEVPSPIGEELAAGDYLAEKLRGLGLDVRRQEVEPNRSNVISSWKGTGGGKSLMFTGHLDTSRHVEGELSGYSIVSMDGDWLFGPGATNMKGCFTAAYAATRMLKEAGLRLKGDLLITAVVGETEVSSVDAGWQSFSGPAYRGAGLGTEFMLRHGVTADMAVIGEPTGLRVQCGNAGYVYAKITTFGKSQHTHTKNLGVSALEKMLKVIQALQAWEPEYQRLYQHPRMLPLINLGSIVSGRPYGPNTTPTYAHLFVHLTTIPGTEPRALKRQLEEVVAAAGAGDPQFQAEVSFYQIRSAYEIPEDAYVGQVVGRAHHEVFGRPSDPIEPSRYSVSSDGSFFQRYGIPSITYGPGGITRSGARLNREEATGQEPLNFENLANCARVYALAALEACGVAA